MQTRPKSAFEYLQEMAQADDARQRTQLNKLALLGQQRAFDDAEQARGIRNRGLSAMQALGGGATDDQRISALRGAGDYGTADALEKSMLERQKTGATVEKDKADAEKTQLANLHAKIDRNLQGLATVNTPQDAMAWLKQGLSEGVMDMQKATTLANQLQTMNPQQLQAWKQQMAAGGMSLKDQVEQQWKAKDFGLREQAQAETGRHNKASEGLTARGQSLADARAREANDINKQAGRSQVVETPDGVMIVDKGTGLARPAATMNGQQLSGKLPEAARKQAAGIDALGSAIGEYRDALKQWGMTDALSPDARAAMGTKYNNMMLQAKEAYNLGVLNGPDFSILQSVITDPRGLMGAVTSNSALDKQASELDRIMQGTKAAVTGKTPAKAQQAAPAAPSGPKAGVVEDGYRFKGGNPADPKNWEKAQ